MAATHGISTRPGRQSDMIDESFLAGISGTADNHGLYSIGLRWAIRPQSWQSGPVSSPVSLKLVSLFSDVGPFGKANEGIKFAYDGNPLLGEVISRISARSGEMVDGIDFSFGGVSRGWVGGNGGSLREWNLAHDERIIECIVSSSDHIHKLEYATSKGRTIVRS